MPAGVKRLRQRQFLPTAPPAEVAEWLEPYRSGWLG